jgi:hypothetical protein
MRAKSRQSGVAWIEVLVVIAILALIGSVFLRLRYGQAWLAAEYSFIQSLGISRDVYDLAKTSVLCIALLGYAAYRFTRARRH